MTYTGMRLLWLLCLPPVPVSSQLTPTPPIDAASALPSPATEPTPGPAARDSATSPDAGADQTHIATSLLVTFASSPSTAASTAFPTTETANITYRTSPAGYGESTALGVSLSMLVLSLALSLLLAVLYAHGIFNQLQRRRWSLGSRKASRPPPLPPRRPESRDSDTLQDFRTPLTESSE
uniref:Membrane protein m162 n=1 Tax=Mastomys natalensis cytomegalovirus 1 TaxID=2973541 RepID=A0A9Y1ILF0_9BETA|nr:membrane protein m162 [Mastomys natalensis cytomegalovirus 1]WEG69013.1 membrane protein m162 [Mastomys natalensis cytomegalovirus 1]WEG71241.1 membrane protein m162 [Mastomys natalensis cytomegalovirus 1]